MTEPVFTPFWNDSGQGQDQWDRLLMADNIWPGLAEISGSGVKRRMDVKKTKGKDGGTLKDNGMDPAKINISLRLWTAEHWKKFNELLPLIHPKRKGGSRTPTEIVHPQCNALGISTIYISQISFPELDRSSGVMTVSMSAIEWMPAPAPVKRAAGTAGGKATGKKEGPKDFLDSALDIGKEALTDPGKAANLIANILWG